MPFEVKVEADKLLTQFLDLQTRVIDLDQKLPQVFLDWQTQDMKRSYPKIDGRGWMSVTTFIYPRSRRQHMKRGSGTATARKKARRTAQRSGTKRPIIRPVLVKQLFDRMVVMCREAIEWR
jgi:hypothetical protein